MSAGDVLALVYVACGLVVAAGFYHVATGPAGRRALRDFSPRVVVVSLVLGCVAVGAVWPLALGAVWWRSLRQ